MTNSPFRDDCLKGNTVLITGGMGAIGRIIVEELVYHGANVAVNDILPAEEACGIFPDRGQTRYFCADITQEAEVVELFKRVEAAFGLPNVVCCHAGIAESYPYWEYPVDRFERLMDINLKGAFLVSREAVRRLRGHCSRHNPGRIIFTSSWVQDEPWPGISAYIASKSGLKMLMQSLAREVADQHILVNSVAPGIVAVGMAKKQWDTEADYRQRAQKAIPLGYMQPPETLAETFVFLASSASRYMTGATLLVDGGCSLYPMDDDTR